MFSETSQAENYQPTTHANSDTNSDTSPTRPTDPLPNENVVNNTILNNPTGWQTGQKKIDAHLCRAPTMQSRIEDNKIMCT